MKSPYVINTPYTYFHFIPGTTFEDPGFVVEDVDTSVDPKAITSDNNAVFTNSNEPSSVFVDPLLQRVSPVAASRFFEKDDISNQQTNENMSNPQSN